MRIKSQERYFSHFNILFSNASKLFSCCDLFSSYVLLSSAVCVWLVSFGFFGSSRAPFSYLATESPNIPAMGRKAESSFLKSSQVRRNCFLQCSSCSFHDGTAVTSLAEERSSKTFIRANENRSMLGTSLTNTAESWCSRHNISQETGVISVERSLAFVNNAHL